MNKNFFENFTLLLNKDRVNQIPKKKQKEQTKSNKQTKQIFPKFSQQKIKNKNKKNNIENNTENNIERLSINDANIPPNIQIQEPKIKANHTTLHNNVEENNQNKTTIKTNKKKENLFDIDWDNILNELKTEIEHKKDTNHTQTTDKTTIENNLKPHKEIDDLEKWNFFNYEDDGKILEEYKDNTDLTWPDEKYHDTHKEHPQKQYIKEKNTEQQKENKYNPWGKQEQEELKEIFTYLDDLFANLPEHVIREFALSPYYIKYNDILDKLDI